MSSTCLSDEDGLFGHPYNDRMEPQDIAAMARKHGIRLLLQFGSSVTGRLHPESDIDFAVLLERVPDSFELEAD